MICCSRSQEDGNIIHPNTQGETMNVMGTLVYLRKLKFTIYSVGFVSVLMYHLIHIFRSIMQHGNGISSVNKEALL